MSFHPVTLAMLCFGIGTATAAPAGANNATARRIVAPAVTPATATRAALQGGPGDAEDAGRPVAYAAVPLPPAAVGAVGCVALVVVLRLSRHRHWVTLR